MNKKLFIYLFFACFGLSCEVCFVAFTNFIQDRSFCNESIYALTGKTYVWMIPIYMLIPFLGGKLFHLFQHQALWQRLMIYVSILYCIEFCSGFILEMLTGKCPWEYTSGWHIAGYIRLDYLPAWTLFVFVVEYLFLYLNKIMSHEK